MPPGITEQVKCLIQGSFKKKIKKIKIIMRVTEKYACEQEYEVCDWCGGGGDTKASECMIA